DPALRRAHFTEAVTATTGIDEAMVAAQVTHFYAAARRDSLLGPVFAKVRDWDAHIARVTDFWSSVVLMGGRYHGSPLAVHQPFPLTEAHFSRWFALWSETAWATCPPAAAKRFIMLAQRMVTSFSRVILVSPAAPACEPSGLAGKRPLEPRRDSSPP
ncbi:MAG: group III truncated hemoglobin, partial [Acetobacteraceae bacterium]